MVVTGVLTGADGTDRCKYTDGLRVTFLRVIRYTRPGVENVQGGHW